MLMVHFLLVLCPFPILTYSGGASGGMGFDWEANHAIAHNEVTAGLSTLPVLTHPIPQTHLIDSYAVTLLRVGGRYGADAVEADIISECTRWDVGVWGRGGGLKVWHRLQSSLESGMVSIMVISERTGQYSTLEIPGAPLGS